MAATAHNDTFARDNLPPRAQWPDLVFDLPELQYPPRLNCAAELLDRMVAAGHGERPAIWAPVNGQPVRCTYRQLLARANRIARALSEDLGLVPGNRVLLRGPNNPMMAACWLGIVKAGGIVVATMPLLRAKELSQIAGKARTSLALCDARLLEELELARPDRSSNLSDLIAWAAIGARTTESQGHRELASGVSCPIGFKNGTYGNLNIAIDAIAAASRPHHFLSVTREGTTAILATKGNEDWIHIILRGGRKPNYDAASVTSAVEELQKAKLPARLMVDFSHANSHKHYRRQVEVAENVAQQIAEGSHAIFGAMIESHLVEGNQKTGGKPREQFVYGQSITDACINFETTEQVLQQLAHAVV